MVNRYLLDRRADLPKLSDSDFKTLKAGVIEQIGRNLTSMKREADYFWSIILGGDSDFNRAEQQIQKLHNLSLKNLQEFFEETFFSDSSRRLDYQMLSHHHESSNCRILEGNSQKMMDMDRKVLFDKISHLKPGLNYVEPADIRDSQRQMNLINIQD